MSMRWLAVAALTLAIVEEPAPMLSSAEGARAGPLQGACYLHFADKIECVGETTEPECRERCDYLLCDVYNWLERRPCWNWGYGG